MKNEKTTLIIIMTTVMLATSIIREINNEGPFNMLGFIISNLVGISVGIGLFLLLVRLLFGRKNNHS